VDYLPAEDGAGRLVAGSIGFHVRDDVMSHLASYADRYDLMIAHPPCTYLALSGNRWRNRPGRQKLETEALDFAEGLWRAPIERIVIEQPRSILSSRIGSISQQVTPYWFGIPEFKTTWLWLKGLPKLKPTKMLKPPVIGSDEFKMWSRVHREPPGPERQKNRSRSYPQMAVAMAEQWGVAA
jgi:hypothetical protein